jgi:hypothetical protein
MNLRIESGLKIFNSSGVTSARVHIVRQGTWPIGSSAKRSGFWGAPGDHTVVSRVADELAYPKLLTPTDTRRGAAEGNHGVAVQAQRHVLEAMIPEARKEHLNGCFAEFPDKQRVLGKALIALLFSRNGQQASVYNGFVEALYKILSLDGNIEPLEIVTKLLTYQSPPEELTNEMSSIAQFRFLSNYDFGSTKARFEELIANPQKLEDLLCAVDGDLPIQTRSLAVRAELGQQIDYASIVRGVIGEKEDPLRDPSEVGVGVSATPGRPLVPFSRRTRNGLPIVQRSGAGSGKPGLTLVPKTEALDLQLLRSLASQLSDIEKVMVFEVLARLTLDPNLTPRILGESCMGVLLAEIEHIHGTSPEDPFQSLAMLATMGSQQWKSLINHSRIRSNNLAQLRQDLPGAKQELQKYLSS